MRDAGNPILNTFSKARGAIFLTYMRPTGICLQS